MAMTTLIFAEVFSLDIHLFFPLAARAGDDFECNN